MFEKIKNYYSANDLDKCIAVVQMDKENFFLGGFEKAEGKGAEITLKFGFQIIDNAEVFGVRPVENLGLSVRNFQEDTPVFKAEMFNPIRFLEFMLVIRKHMAMNNIEMDFTDFAERLTMCVGVN